MNKTDIQHRDDIIQMVNSFYQKVQQDPLIGPIFQERIQNNWNTHLEKMYDFWENILLGTNAYHGRPFPPHLQLPIQKIHFDTWLQLFNENIDQQFEGPNSQEAKLRALTIARIFQSKIAHFQSLSNKANEETR